MISILDSRTSPTWWRNFNTVDNATLAYHFGILMTSGLVSLNRGLPLATFLFNLLAILFVIGIRALSTKVIIPFTRFLADFYPLFFFLPIYEQVGKINRIVNPVDIDPILKHFDWYLFGSEPAFAMSKAFHPAWFSEYMHFSYFNFYWMFSVLGLILAYRHPPAHFRRFITALCLTFYTCNFLFTFLPALGPTTFLGTVAPKGGWIFTPLMTFIYLFEIPGGAFPSSHVALTMVTLYYSYLLQSGRILFRILGLSLIFATVYCGYHYVVDAIGGLLVAAILIAWTETYFAAGPGIAAKF